MKPGRVGAGDCRAKLISAATFKLAHYRNFASFAGKHGTGAMHSETIDETPALQALWPNSHLGWRTLKCEGTFCPMPAYP
jgi:hypothetical protein